MILTRRPSKGGVLMAVLADSDRLRIWCGIMRLISARGEGLPGVLKADLRAAVNATDAWIDANQAAYNTALPSAFRTNATLLQKTLLFCAVAAMRVNVEAVRAVLGQEVD